MAQKDAAGEPVETASLACFKPLAPVEGSRVALMVAHAPAGRLKPHVPIYCAALAKAGVKTVLIAATDDPLTVDPELTQFLAGGYARGNRGYDFAAWAHLLKVEPALARAATLYLVNDSVIGPLNQNRLDDLLDRVEKNSADVVGATESFEITWHLQSYFLAFKPRALASAAFHDFFNAVRSQPAKRAVVLTYEVPLALRLSRDGLRCAPAYESANAVNQLVFHWREMIAAGFPFAKTIVLSGFYPKVDISGWRETLAAAGYDPAIADATIEASRPPPAPKSA